jgi:hypothetical protein
LGEFSGFTLIYEENLFGGIEIWVFLGFWSVIHVGLLRWGTNGVPSVYFGGI